MQPPTSTTIRLFWLYLLAVTILAGGMRLYKLSDYSFWEDELYTVRSSVTLDEGQLSKRFGYIPSAIGMMVNGVDLNRINHDNTAQWRDLGVTEFNVRIGPSLVGILSIPLLALAGRRLLGDRATLIAALILTVSPWHLFWSQAGRFYTLQFLCYNLALIWYLRSCLERSTRLAACSAVALVLAFLSQPPALVIAVVLFADVVGCLIRREPVGLSKTGWTFGIGAVLLCLGIQVYDMKSNVDDWQYFGSLEGHSWKVIAASMVLRNHPVLMASAVLCLPAIWRSSRRLASYLAAGAVLPVLALMVLSFAPNMYVHERYCFVVHYAWIVATALGLAMLWETVATHRGTWLAATATVIITMTFLWTDLGYYQDGYRRRWKEAFAYVQPRRQPGEDLACFSSIGTPIARYYLQTDDVLPYHDFPTSPEKLHALKRPTWLVLPAVSATRGELFPWMNDMADLKRYYDLRVLQPFASVRVYYYHPSMQTQTQAPLLSQP